MESPVSLKSTLLYFSLLILVQSVELYKLCTTNKTNHFNRCQTLTTGDSQLECVQVADSVDCALKLQEGLADFGVFTAEEALLASNFIDKSVQVIADIRHVERLMDPFAFQAVVVVKQGAYNSTLDSLNGSNFCHPGFAPGQFWTDSVLKQFERTVVATPCDQSLSAVEQEVKALSTFFKSTCRPGPWVLDDMFDERLKANYSNLCGLCDSPKTCSYASHETGSHRAALSCLTHRGGDIAYVALRYVQQYFGLETGYSPEANKNEFSFLCPNGSTVALDNLTPCAWIQQPWRGVLARRDIALPLQPQLLTWLNSTADSRSPWQQALWDLTLEPDHALHPITALLSNFVRQNGETRQSCNGSVRWCVTSTSEARKCEWLRAATQSHGLRPALDCALANSSWQCWSNVQNGLADVVSVDTEYGYIARQSFQLSPFAYLDGGINNNFQILAIVASTNQIIQSWNNVRQTKACFPEFGGLAWISAVSTLVMKNQLPKICPYASAMASYLAGACAPGARDNPHTRGSGFVPASLCSVCSTHNTSDSCSTSSSNVFYGDLGALRCLSSGFGDIAFIDYRQLAGSDGVLAQDLEPSSYRVLCRNGSLATTTGLTVDDDCALAHGVGSEVMARSDRSSIKTSDLTELLLEMDKWFGSTSLSKLDSTFHMYSKFQDMSDLLFKDSTRGVVLPNDSGYSYVNDYRKLQERSAVCDKNRNNGVPLLPSIVLLVVIAICPFIL